MAEEDESPGKPQPLPTWIASPIEKCVEQWVEQYQGWMEKIDQRALEGKALPPSLQQKYDFWNENSREVHLLYSKRTRSLAPPPRKNASLSRLKQELISVTLNLSMEASELQIRAGASNPRRLVILQGTHQCEDEGLPGFLDQSVGVGLEEALNQGEEAQNEGASDVDMDEIEGRMDEEEAALEGELQQDPQEVLAYSSEEEGLEGFIGTPCVRVKSFLHRESYRRLCERGLTALPGVPGVHISYHAGSRTWTGFYESSKGKCFTHGGTTLRSESEALLLCLKAVIEAHVAKQPRDGAWKAQLEKIKATEATCANL